MVVVVAGVVVCDYVDLADSWPPYLPISSEAQDDFKLQWSIGLVANNLKAGGTRSLCLFRGHKVICANIALIEIGYKTIVK